MTKMIRKEIYIDPDLDAFLSEASQAKGTSESAFVRSLLRRCMTESGRRTNRDAAWERLRQLLEERRALQVAQTGRTWTRDDLYDDPHRP
jgi:hypothetical protein